MKSKSFLAGLTVVTAVLFFAGCESQGNVQTSQSQSISQAAQTSPQLGSLFNPPSSQGTSAAYDSQSEQQSIQDLVSQNQKIMDKAEQSKDASLCDQLSDPNLIGSCQYNIYTNEAVQKKDPSLCTKITNPDYEKTCQQTAQKS